MALKYIVLSKYNFSRSSGLSNVFNSKRLWFYTSSAAGSNIFGTYIYDGSKDLYDILKKKLLKEFKLTKYDKETIEQANLYDKQQGVMGQGSHNITFDKVDAALNQAVKDAKPVPIFFYKPENANWYSGGWAMGFVEQLPGGKLGEPCIYAFPTGRAVIKPLWEELCQDIISEKFRQECKHANFNITKWGANPSENVISKKILVYKDFKSYVDHYGAEMKDL